MRKFYMDTNVFISSLKPDDPYHSEAKIITRSLVEEKIQANTSVLTLLETASVVSRIYEAKKGNQKERRIFVIKALRRLASFKINFIHITGDAPIAIRNIRADMPNIFNEAILLSLHSTLRTLDLIHLAAARYAKQMNRDLGAFVTGDSEFLSKKEELLKILKMPVLSPREYVQALGIQN
ncbi:MAG: type II toxin-antitoxin system VapC family toxin [Nitrososphaerales archaeon]